MSSSCDPALAPAGDVVTALLMIDSRLKCLHERKAEIDPEQRKMIEEFTASLDREGANAVLDGACTLIFMYMTWLRSAYERHDKDVIENVVPHLVATMRMMPASISPEVIPTMAGLVIAAGNDLSPNLWRKQYGDWTDAEMTPLEATATLLAEHINGLTGDPDFATRMISDALAAAG
ncbi:hypothetical protein AAHZ94_05575 [Streptomyces sp. HSW2009]|uniref:hypothetical protein n=1 Tax=Streptomyces sp. HSW2009 TaxID=3142890 RepID=UPI0032EF072E